MYESSDLKTDMGPQLTSRPRLDLSNTSATSRIGTESSDLLKTAWPLVKRDVPSAGFRLVGPPGREGPQAATGADADGAGEPSEEIRYVVANDRDDQDRWWYSR
jgi:hypothetical protein